ncbi:hypothetical protein [uncultured Amnibacterium sp.]|uniref:hypothetical protein n=1 Tax=uncultured Amnibacterium sp. TaxID=1631851 RepID=UPI0035CBDE94
MTTHDAGTDGPFSLEEGLAAGYTAGELRSGRWIRPFAGVRSYDEPQTVEDLARAYAPKMRSEAYFSHATSAVLLWMWLPLALQSRMLLHVAVPPHVRAPRDRLVKGHHLIDRPGLIWTHDGLRIASARETWCQLATILGMEDLIIAGESLLAKNRPGRLRLDDLVTAVAAGDRPRQAMLERALPQLREGSRSAKETELRRLLVRNGLPEPQINGDVFDDDGTWVAECDLVYRAWKVLVEYEGEDHFTKRQGRKDVRKYELLRAMGWTVVRVVQEDLADPVALAARVGSALAAA